MSSFPGEYNFTVKQPDWVDYITWSIDNVAVNMTGYTVTLRVKFATGSVDYSTAAGVTGNASGVVSWDLDVSAWPAGSVDYDLKAVSPDGTVNWLLAGTVTVTP